MVNFMTFLRVHYFCRLSLPNNGLTMHLIRSIQYCYIFPYSLHLQVIVGGAQEDISLQQLMEQGNTGISSFPSSCLSKYGPSMFNFIHFICVCFFAFLGHRRWRPRGDLATTADGTSEHGSATGSTAGRVGQPVT